MPLHKMTTDSLLALSSILFEKENLWGQLDIQKLLRMNMNAIDRNVLNIAEKFSKWSKRVARLIEQKDPPLWTRCLPQIST